MRSALRTGRRAVAASAFDLVFQPWMHRRFASIVVRGRPSLPPGQPVILAANHVSWWDGFLLREAARELRRGAPFFAVMLARELARNRFLALLGALPLEPGSLTSTRALVRRLERERQRRPDVILGFFPQGRLWPSQRRPLGFRRGLALVARTLAPVTVVPVAIHIEPHASPSPTAYVLLGHALKAAPSVEPAAVERVVERMLDELMRELNAADAPERA